MSRWKYRAHGVQSESFRKWAKDNNRIMLPDGSSVTRKEVKERESKAKNRNKESISF